MAISKKSGRPIRKPTAAINKTVLVQNIFTPRIRSYTVGELSVRHKAKAMTIKIAMQVAARMPLIFSPPKVQ